MQVFCMRLEATKRLEVTEVSDGVCGVSILSRWMVG